MTINHKKVPRYTKEQKDEMYAIYLKYGFTNCIENFHISKSTLTGIIKERKFPVGHIKDHEPEGNDYIEKLKNYKWLSKAQKKRLLKEVFNVETI